MTWARIASIAGPVLALAVVFGLWTVDVARLKAAQATAISAEEKKTRDAQGAFDAYKLEVEQTQANIARMHASDLLALLDQKETLESENDRLRTEYATAARERGEASRQLLRILNNAPKTPASDLDPASVDFFARLRGQQLGTSPAASAAPAS